MDHEQYNLPSTVPTNLPTDLQQKALDWYSTGNILRTDKSINVKNRFTIDDNELNIYLGQKFKRTAFSTLITGSVYSVSANDYLIGITSLSYAPTVGLPNPKIIGQGKTYIVKDEVGGAASTTITVRSEGEKTIDGAATATITTNYGAKEFYSDGTNWFIK